MSLSGLTLEVVGGENINEAPSVLILEILSSSPGITQWMKEWMRDGNPVICGTKWTEAGLSLFLLPNWDDSGSLRTNWLVSNAERLERLGVSASDLGLLSPKNGIERSGR